MELLVEFIVDFFVELTVSIADDPKVKRWIRYTLMSIVGAFFVFILGIAIYRHNIAASIALSVIIIAGIIFDIITNRSKISRQ